MREPFWILLAGCLPWRLGRAMPPPPSMPTTLFKQIVGLVVAIFFCVLGRTATVRPVGAPASDLSHLHVPILGMRGRAGSRGCEMADQRRSHRSLRGAGGMKILDRERRPGAISVEYQTTSNRYRLEIEFVNLQVTPSTGAAASVVLTGQLKAVMQKYNPDNIAWEMLGGTTTTPFSITMSSHLHP